MVLTPLTKMSEIVEAYKVFNRRMKKGGREILCTVGYKGGSFEGNVCWQGDVGIWLHLDPEFASNRYWCAFGTEEAIKQSNLSITCEINIPYKSINRRVAAVFACDEEGNRYICHSGKVGGGRKGIGKTAFLDSFQGGDQIVGLSWPDGVETQSIMIGNIDSKELLAQIAHFVHQVDSFKRAVVTGKKPSPPGRAVTNDTFSPEFSGEKKSYSPSEIIRSQCNHGTIINALQKKLEDSGMKACNDSKHDLYVVDDAGHMKILFEAKTELSSGSIYSAIGQLMYNGAVQASLPRRVLVVPGKPEPQTARVLACLGIEILVYIMVKEKVGFVQLGKLISDR